MSNCKDHSEDEKPWMCECTERELARVQKMQAVVEAAKEYAGSLSDCCMGGEATGDVCELHQALAAIDEGAAVESIRIVGRCVEVGDDADGQPRLIIHTTREELKRFGRNLAFADVIVTGVGGKATGDSQ